MMEEHWIIRRQRFRLSFERAFGFVYFCSLIMSWETEGQLGWKEKDSLDSEEVSGMNTEND